MSIFVANITRDKNCSKSCSCYVSVTIRLLYMSAKQCLKYNQFYTNIVYTSILGMYRELDNNPDWSIRSLISNAIFRILI